MLNSKVKLGFHPLPTAQRDTLNLKEDIGQTRKDLKITDSGEQAQTHTQTSGERASKTETNRKLNTEDYL